MAHMMYTQHPMTGQKPETFMLSTEAMQALPESAQRALQQVDNLKYFLISAPVDWSPNQYIRRFLLPTGDYVSCVLWNNLFHISGTDIVRCLSFRFQAFGRPVKNSKKFEEGIFSDLRNLKAGTDATLEEPKSPFLDFLYKQNCIRTQKKQKVFYWYSVPHDRLFLDALERDLKREKMGQEATTVAVEEPALSFEFDSSQSLYEQLTKANQANSSSFSAHAATPFSTSASPVIRAMDSMPPPMIPHSLSVVPDDLSGMGAYSTIQVPTTLPLKREDDLMAQYPFDRNTMALARPMHQRHVSMPSYLEYSPAPSFASSQLEDYSTGRAISYEPVTPPQQLLHIQEPQYISNDGTLYQSIPDSVHSILPMPGAGYSTTPRGYGNSVYTVIEGSPTYKQRRRRSSIPPGVAALTNATNAATGHNRRSSDQIRRAAAVVSENQGGDLDSVNIGMQVTQKEIVDLTSRHGTPMSMSMMEGSPAPHMLSHHHTSPMPPTSNCELSPPGHDSLTGSPLRRPTSLVRRAKSATVMEIGPYPQKSHSCPIPSCGRLFKRLEHLKRHVRTHTQERPYICNHCNKAFSRSDNLAQHRKTHDRDASVSADHYGNYSGEEDIDGEEENIHTVDDGSDGSADGYMPPMTTVGMSNIMPAPAMVAAGSYM
ncbi:STE like transcription factor-domain-containing protein [Kalaharituber pfeilii]|nr:STE like transcription factor-domain-containing protein [Kalaharituber pfeilii]